MKDAKKTEKLRNLRRLLKAKLKPHRRRTTTTPEEAVPNESGLRFDKPHSFAYHLLGERTRQVMPLFSDLSSNLQSSGLKINFKAYVSLTVLSASSVSLATLAFIPFLLFLVLGVPAFSAILFGVGGSLFAFAFSVIGFYVYPIYRADKLKREMEDELPFTTGYMAILTSAGVSPERTFASLSNVKPPLAVTVEAKDVVRDVNLFGSDIISALEDLSKITPSERFHEMLEGLISTIHSGGDLAAYLRVKSAQYMKLKRIGLRKFSDTLSMLSEFYVALLITGPLLMVIMLAVMAMLGGGLGFLSPSLLLNLLTYIGIPLGSLMFIIILDSASPKW